MQNGTADFYLVTILQFVPISFFPAIGSGIENKDAIGATLIIDEETAVFTADAGMDVRHGCVVNHNVVSCVPANQCIGQKAELFASPFTAANNQPSR